MLGRFSGLIGLLAEPAEMTCNSGSAIGWCSLGVPSETCAYRERKKSNARYRHSGVQVPDLLWEESRNGLASPPFPPRAGSRSRSPSPGIESERGEAVDRVALTPQKERDVTQ